MTVAFDEVEEKITDAARQIEADRDASPVLVAVVLGVPGEACEGGAASDRNVPSRDSATELEQASDRQHGRRSRCGGCLLMPVNRCSPLT